MESFSKRYGYNKKQVQFEYADDTIKRRILTAFYTEEFTPDGPWDMGPSLTGIERMMSEIGVSYKYPINDVVKEQNASKLQKYVYESPDWYAIYDFIDHYFKLIQSGDKIKKMTGIFNEILEEEVSAYRIVERRVTPITNEYEIQAISAAIHVPYKSVQTHISKALDSFSNRKKPDYENTIKDSISAVEAMCCIITNMKKATLGDALKALKKHDIHIHQSMERAFLALYGYTSDEKGIRHGGIDFQRADSEDALYMLVTCSAFINYLGQKWRKVEKKEE